MTFSLWYLPKYTFGPEKPENDNTFLFIANFIHVFSCTKSLLKKSIDFFARVGVLEDWFLKEAASCSESFRFSNLSFSLYTCFNSSNLISTKISNLTLVVYDLIEPLFHLDPQNKSRIFRIVWKELLLFCCYSIVCMPNYRIDLFHQFLNWTPQTNAREFDWEFIYFESGNKNLVLMDKHTSLYYSLMSMYTPGLMSCHRHKFFQLGLIWKLQSLTVCAFEKFSVCLFSLEIWRADKVKRNSINSTFSFSKFVFFS